MAVEVAKGMERRRMVSLDAASTIKRYTVVPLPSALLSHLPYPPAVATTSPRWTRENAEWGPAEVEHVGDSSGGGFPCAQTPPPPDPDRCAFCLGSEHHRLSVDVCT